MPPSCPCPNASSATGERDQLLIVLRLFGAEFLCGCRLVVGGDVAPWPLLSICDVTGLGVDLVRCNGFRPLSAAAAAAEGNDAEFVRRGPPVGTGRGRGPPPPPLVRSCGCEFVNGFRLGGFDGGVDAVVVVG